MIFQAHAKGLRLVMVAGHKEVDKSSGLPIVIQHPQREIRFGVWRYETEDPLEIEWLKKHRLFSEAPSLPGTFWVFVPPRNMQSELDAKDAEIAALKAKLAPVQEPATTPEAPASSSPMPELQASIQPPIQKPPFCDSCDSKGVKHLKDCPKNPKNVVPVVA